MMSEQTVQLLINKLPEILTGIGAIAAAIFGFLTQRTLAIHTTQLAENTKLTKQTKATLENSAPVVANEKISRIDETTADTNALVREVAEHTDQSTPQATICSRSIGHDGPCNGLPKLGCDVKCVD